MKAVMNKLSKYKFRKTTSFSINSFENDIFNNKKH